MTRQRTRFWCAGVLIFVALSSALALEANTNSTTVYSTGFEASEGYNSRLALAGQRNWVAEGSGGNGIVTNFFAGLGQQAFIGFSKPTDTNDAITVWRPINFSPAAMNRPVVKFSVEIEFVDSTNGQYDDFRWSIYNTNGIRLFSSNFDNSNFLISYAGEGSNFQSTGFNFAHDERYLLEVAMNFSRNTWTASINGGVIINAQAITTKNAALNFGDADAVWVVANAAKPGDNFMLFDNYTITADATPYLPTQLDAADPPPPVAKADPYNLRINGEPGVTYLLEASTDLKQWTPVQSLISTNGIIDFTDNVARYFDRRFYRARVVTQ